VKVGRSLSRDIGDTATRFLNRAFDLMFTKYPTRTSIGVFVGVTLDGIAAVLVPVMSVAMAAAIGHVKLWHYVALGVVLLHVPTLVHLVRHRADLDEQCEHAIAVIERAPVGVEEKRSMYRELVRRVMDQLVVTQESRSASPGNDLREE